MKSISEMHDAAIRAGRAGDMRGFFVLAGSVGRRVIGGDPMPESALWVLDPKPVVGGEKCPAINIAGPMLVELWREEDRRDDVAAWLASCLAHAYTGQWGKLLAEDWEANAQSLRNGSRLMCVYPWFGEAEESKDLWCFIEAAHIEDGTLANSRAIRRVSFLHRSDY